jgi:alcohol dehydrogenase class IV
MKTTSPFLSDPEKESVFTVNASAIKFGPGALRELGTDAKSLGMKRIAFFVDPRVLKTELGDSALDSLHQNGLDFEVFEDIRFEPNSDSIERAAQFAQKGKFDGFVSLGGGSVMDTAKLANLLSCYPDDLMAYVNAPIGQAKPIPGRLKPHIACPTTCGTGSETTGIAIIDLIATGLKSGVASVFLKPNLAIIDPTSSESMPPGVVAASGFDVLTHAVESYTARSYQSRERTVFPHPRPSYQGATPFNDLGALEAIRIGGQYLVRAVSDPNDKEARHSLVYASMLAGMAFGSAGVHIPHAMSYSIATLRHEYLAAGYEFHEPMVPHGVAVVINAPAAFRFTAAVNPERHLQAAQALGSDLRGAQSSDAGEVLAQKFIQLMKDTGLPNGIAELGYKKEDIPALAKGAYAQQRPLVMSPRPVKVEDLERIYENAMKYW